MVVSVTTYQFPVSTGFFLIVISRSLAVEHLSHPTAVKSAFLVSYRYIAFSGFQWRQEELEVFFDNGIDTLSAF
jgi:hypothetical protein